MSGKQIKRLRRRCRALWQGPLAGMLQERYGVGGFDRFFTHAKKDHKEGNLDFLDALEKKAEEQAAEDKALGF